MASKEYEAYKARVEAQVSDAQVWDFIEGKPFTAKNREGVSYKVYPVEDDRVYSYSIDIDLEESKPVLLWNSDWLSKSKQSDKEFLYSCITHISVNADFLYRRSQNPEKPFCIYDGATIPVYGVPTRIQVSNVKVTQFNEDKTVILVPRRRNIVTAVQDLLKSHALAIFTELTHQYGDQLLELLEWNSDYRLRSPWPIKRGRNIYVELLSGRFTRTAGACWSHENRIGYRYNLITAEPNVVHQIVAHEVAHLCVSPHNDKFWNLVAELREHSIEDQREEDRQLDVAIKRGLTLGHYRRYLETDSPSSLKRHGRKPRTR